MARRSSKKKTESWWSMVWERRGEIASAVLLFVSAFALVSLAGWNEADATWVRPRIDGAAAHNPCGPLGANVADLLYRIVGGGAWIVLLGLWVPVVSLAGRRFSTWPRWAVGSWLYVVALGIAELGFGGMPDQAYAPGGRVGSFVAQVLLGVVGRVGAWMVLLTAFVSAASLLLGVSWRDIAHRVVDRYEAEMPEVRARAVTAGGTVGDWLKALVWAVTDAVHRAARWLGVMAWRAVYAMFVRTRAGISRGVASTRSTVVRGWAALVHGRTAGAEVEDGEWEDVTGLQKPEASGHDFKHLVGLGTEVTQVSEDAPWVDAAWEEPEVAGAAEDVLEMFPTLVRREVRQDAGVAVAGRPAIHVQSGVGGAARRASHTAIKARPARLVRPAAAHDETHTGPDTSWDSASATSPHDVPGVQVTASPAVAVAIHADVAPSDTSGSDVHALTDHGGQVTDPTSLVSTGTAGAPPRAAAASPVASPLDAPRPNVPPVRAVGSGVQVEKADGLEGPRVDDGGAVSDHQSLYFQLPALSLLDPIPEQRAQVDEAVLVELASTVEESLGSFKVSGKVTSVRVGPVVTTFEFLPDAGISVRKISNLQDDLAMALRATSVRVVAPIPGKGVVGIEIPSRHRMTIYLREVLASDAFRKHGGALPVVLGKDVENNPVVADLAKMPHLLVGGTTGSGKSVGVNAMLMSLLYTKTPDELRLLLVDPKKLEFEAYSETPHLLHPVVTEPPKAAAALAWACREMDRRYELLARWKTRNIANYNRKVQRESRNWTREKAIRYASKDWTDADALPQPESLPYIVIVIDELADLMLVAKKDVQDSIVRLAQMARACGMHLIIATQRPSVDVVTGLIKSNMPTRIAFKLRSVVDSRTILDQGGAEKLLGMGDMLHLPGAGDVARCHGPFVSDDEVGRVIQFLRDQRAPDFITDITATIDEDRESDDIDDDLDPLYDRAVTLVIEEGKASTSMVQRHLRVGYNRAARIVDSLERMGVVGPADGARPREVLVGRNVG